MQPLSRPCHSAAAVIAAAAVVVFAAASAAVIASAEAAAEQDEQDENNDDDPQTVVTAEESVAIHALYLHNYRACRLTTLHSIISCPVLLQTPCSFQEPFPVPH